MLMVEHHMEVVIGLAERIAVMHHGALLAVRHARRGDGERDRADRRTWGSRCERVAAEPLISGRRPARLPRRVARAAGRLVRRARGRRHRAARPERRRQDDDAAGDDGPRAAPRHASTLAGEELDAAADARDRAARRRLRARGPRRLRRADRRREPAPRRARRRRRATSSSTSSSRSCASAARSGRDALGRPAADGRDRAGAAERQPACCSSTSRRRGSRRCS